MKAILSQCIKNVLWPHYSGPPGARGPGSLNRLNPRFLRHCLRERHFSSTKKHCCERGGKKERQRERRELTSWCLFESWSPVVARHDGQRWRALHGAHWVLGHNAQMSAVVVANFGNLQNVNHSVIAKTITLTLYSHNHAARHYYSCQIYAYVKPGFHYPSWRPE